MDMQQIQDQITWMTINQHYHDLDLVIVMAKDNVENEFEIWMTQQDSLLYPCLLFKMKQHDFLVRQDRILNWD